MCTAAAAAAAAAAATTTAFLAGNVVGLFVHGRAQPEEQDGPCACTNTRFRSAVPTFMEIVLDTTLSSRGKM